MPLNFPTSPTTNEIYTYSGNSWIWNSYAWDSVVGGTEPVGNYVISFNGLTGAVTGVGTFDGITGSIVKVDGGTFA